MDQVVLTRRKLSAWMPAYRSFVIGAVAIVLSGSSFGQFSGSTFSPGLSWGGSATTGDGRSPSAFRFVGENSVYKDAYTMTESRVSGTVTVEVDSRSKTKPPNKDEVRKYLQGFELKGEQLEKATNLMLAADRTVRGWINALDALDLPEKRLADLAEAADKLRLAQFRLEGQLYERRGQPARMGAALDAFDTHLQSQISK